MAKAHSRLPQAGGQLVSAFPGQASRRRVYTSIMRVAIWTLMLISCVLAGAQATTPTFDLYGNLKLVDLPPASTHTPVQKLLVTLELVDGGFSVHTHPDPSGNFVLRNLRPGRYDLRPSWGGRIVTFARGGQNLRPDGFRLAGGGPPLHIALSLKASSLLVEARGLPANHNHLVVLLAAADSHLGLRHSCFQAPLKGHKAEFPYIPPGRYRGLIIDSQFLAQASVYAPRNSDFLKNRATPVEVLSGRETKVTATYVDRNTIKQAVRHSGPRPPHKND